MNVFSQYAPKEIFDSLDVVADIDNPWLQHLLPAEREELARQSSSSFRGLGNIPRHLGNLGIAFRPVREHFCISDNHSKHVIEVMRDSAGQSSNRFHFLHVA